MPRPRTAWLRLFTGLAAGLTAGLTGCTATPEAGLSPRGGGLVQLAPDAVIYFGNAYTSTRPAVIDLGRVRDATPEWRTIQQDGVRQGSARHGILLGEMDHRIKEAVTRAARAQGRDLVVRRGDIRDPGGLPVADLTDVVIGG